MAVVCLIEVSMKLREIHQHNQWYALCVDILKHAECQTKNRVHRFSDDIKKGAIMNTNRLEGQWQQLKGEIRSRWGKLTDDDLERISGNKDKLIGVVQEKYGYVWDEARDMVDRYLDESGDLRTKATEALKAVASRDNLEKLRSEVVGFVRHYPIPSLLIGLGVGYLLAKSTHR